MTNLSLLTANLDFRGSGGPYKDRTSTKIADYLLSQNPTFIALQEAGGTQPSTKPRYLNVDEYQKFLLAEKLAKELETELRKRGYGVIYPKSDKSNAVSTRLFYFSDNIELIKELPPIYDVLPCRQSGGLFKINNKTIAVFSLHFPLLENCPVEKIEMWDKYIHFASEANDTYDHVILAGDFNESMSGNFNGISILDTSSAFKLKEMREHMIDASEDLPTWTDKKLDHIFVTPNTKIKDYSTIDNNFSDHKALQLTFNV
ncbi:endonuclease [Streptococcus lutetiensis]|uniref:endonuclease/exonuclease/phosphatase family protein n=1 Tax=Streptococcus lutetiensis TaxID=150055 RepID=UPI001BD994FE|nr:endonuclease/exonuclease/phosphatase family protein [Streptococcus lutetiensis]MBT0899343.1 endonuclease [Streptococcus lutetiensis]MBT1058086.1 endonuclease [Streptococcus lutetiensis]MBT1059804.1 endonuclease [Streptococcus lutetiensis]